MPLELAGTAMQFTTTSADTFVGTGTGTGTMMSKPAKETMFHRNNVDESDGHLSSPSHLSRSPGGAPAFASRPCHPTSASLSCGGAHADSKRLILSDADARDFTRLWHVVSDWKSLPRIPPLYDLAPSKTTVPAVASSSPAVVADRIATHLRELSLDAVYDDSRAKAFVTSCDGVEFFVRLFQDDGTTGGGGRRVGSIVVEIQRKRGCAYRFHRYARSVLRAAAAPVVGVSDASDECSAETRRRRSLLLRPSLSSASSLPRSRCIHRQLLAPPALASFSNEDEYAVERALETADDLLQKDRLDANELGMESLVLLTSEDSSGLDRALRVSRVLVLGDGHGDDDEKFSGLRKRLASLSAQKNNLSGDEEYDDDDDDDDDDDGDEGSYEHRHNETMRRHAMVALGNALALLARHDADRLRAVLRSGDSWLGADAGSLLPALVSELERAESRPHDACAAARCLVAVLVASSPDGATCRRAKELGVPERLAVARGVGWCRHAMLARESEAALVLL